MPDAFICTTCGVQFAPSTEPPGRCPVCEDARQFVPESGQRWTTAEALRRDHRNLIRADGGLVGVGVDPQFAIGQRALLVPCGATNLMWDCAPLLDATEEIERRGGLAAVAISHPHFYSTMVDWAHRFDCPIYLHADDSRWIMRPDPSIELWEGTTRQLGEELTLVRLGGHFPGATVLHAGRGLLSGDVVQVIPDRGHVSFMYSYPNLIPLAEREVRAIVDTLAPFAFDRLIGGWWDTVVAGDAQGKLGRSADRYVRALRGDYPRG